MKKISCLERRFMGYLKEHGIKGWIREFPLGKSQLDFAFPKYKIDVEIDGPSHLLPNRKKADRNRDARLKQMGWRVLRFDLRDVLCKEAKCITILLGCMKGTVSYYSGWRNKLKQKNKSIKISWVQPIELLSRGERWKQKNLNVTL